MKAKKYSISVLGSLLILAAACTKDKGEIPASLPASVNVINATLNQLAVKVNRFGSTASLAALNDSVSSGFNYIYPVASGLQPFTIVVASDTLKSIISGNTRFTPNGIYSLYIGATAPNYDTMMVSETIIPTYQDSSIGIRFVHMATGGPAINVNLAATPSVTAFTGLAYRSQSSFTKLALPANPDYNNITYEVRDAATNTVLATYTLPQYASYPGVVSIDKARFRAVTLVFTGQADNGSGISTYQVFAVNNY